MLLLSACVGTEPCREGYGRASSGACVRLATAEEDGALADSGAEGAGDSGELPDTGPSEELPWATASNMDPHGELPCDDPGHPCSHRLRLAVPDGEEVLELDFDLGLQASVGAAMMLDHGEIEGQRWVELQVVYLDFYTPNFHTGEESNPARASIAFPLEAAAGPEDLAGILGEERAWRWVHRTLEVDTRERLIDPEPVLVEDGEGGHRYFLLGLEDGQDALVLLECAAPAWERCSEIARPLSEVTWSDPDPFPEAWKGLYPAAVDASYLPGGEGGWILHLSEGPRLRRLEGGLEDISSSEGREVVDGTGVSGTAMRDGEVTVYGHSAGASYEATSLLAHSLDGEVYGEAVEVLAPSTANPMGASSPDRFSLPNGLDAFVFHTMTDPVEERHR